MKQELETLLNIVRSYKEAKRAFYRAFQNRYPNLMENIADYEDNLNDELEFLLSSCLISKNIKIKLESDITWIRWLVLSKKPGLRSFRSSTRGVRLMDVRAIDKDGNLIFKSYSTDANSIVKLGVIRQEKYNKYINKKRLEDFYKFIERAIPLWTKSEDFYSMFSKTNNNIQVGSLIVTMASSGFFIGMKGQYLKNDLIHGLIESEDEEKSIACMFLRDFEAFDRVLLMKDKEKGEILTEMKKLLSEIKEYNKPEKLFNRLTE